MVSLHPLSPHPTALQLLFHKPPYRHLATYSINHNNNQRRHNGKSPPSVAPPYHPTTLPPFNYHLTNSTEWSCGLSRRQLLTYLLNEHFVNRLSSWIVRLIGDLCEWCVFCGSIGCGSFDGSLVHHIRKVLFSTPTAICGKQKNI